MKKYQVFKHPDNRLDAVKVGFSFPGVIFGFIWLLWHKMWLIGGLVTFASFAVYFIFPNPEGYILGVPYGHKFGISDILNMVCSSLWAHWAMNGAQDRYEKEALNALQQSGLQLLMVPRLNIFCMAPIRTSVIIIFKPQVLRRLNWECVLYTSIAGCARPMRRSRRARTRGACSSR